MKLLSALALGVLILSSAARLGAQTGVSGDSAGTRAALARAAEENPKDIAALTGYAEFLERYGDPACREAYAKLLEALRNTGDTARAGLIARRLAVIDLLDGGIETRTYYPIPLHLQECYKSLGYKNGSMRESEMACREAFSIPVFPEMTQAQKNYVVDKIAGFFR